ncbi:DoxX family membrane protein [Candidatus Pacearchaeota archaeon]|nr:DoxX family membrane protein [Candidatus Pacearchaeota archaeon]
MAFLENAGRYTPSLVRYAVGIVFLLIGIMQFSSPESWIGYLAEGFSIPFGISLTQAMTGIGAFNALVGLLLIIGLITRIAAALAVLHLIGVIASIGYNDISIRDFGLLLAALSVFLNGTDSLCLEKAWKRQ